eukprot:scaffold2866_cov248-Pinguiococcus_pyrenoidosus.AAC.2
MNFSALSPSLHLEHTYFGAGVVSEERFWRERLFFDVVTQRQQLVCARLPRLAASQSSIDFLEERCVGNSARVALQSGQKYVRHAK